MSLTETLLQAKSQPDSVTLTVETDGIVLTLVAPCTDHYVDNPESLVRLIAESPSWLIRALAGASGDLQSNVGDVFNGGIVMESEVTRL